MLWLASMLSLLALGAGDLSSMERSWIEVDVPSVQLHNAAVHGLMMPVSGIGTWGYGGPGKPGEQWNDSSAEVAIKAWLQAGGRRIDGSLHYGDQAGVGKAVAESGIARNKLFITSKIPCNGYNASMDHVHDALSTLNTSYVDLLLIHWPFYPHQKSPPSDEVCTTNATAGKCRQATWRALEKLFHNGVARAIGVSNFEVKHLQDIISLGGLLPSVNQVEYHPYWHEDDLVTYCKSHNITFNSYSPLGAPDWAPIVKKWPNGKGPLAEPAILKIAMAHKKSAAQVILKWQWQQGIVVNPRTWNVTHMQENLNFFDFELSAAEMSEISKITPPTPGGSKVCPDPNLEP